MCRTSIKSQHRFKQQRTSCVVKDITGFTKENLTKELDSYKQILEQTNPSSMVIKLRGEWSYKFEVGETYILQCLLRGYISQSHAGVTIKLQ